MKDDIHEILSKADIVVLPSIEREGLGISIIEAMCHGKPVIGCKGEGIEDFITHGKTGILINKKNISQITEAIEKLIIYPEYANLLGKNGKKLVNEEYTWSKNAEKNMLSFCIK